MGIAWVALALIIGACGGKPMCIESSGEGESCPSSAPLDLHRCERIAPGTERERTYDLEDDCAFVCNPYHAHAKQPLGQCGPGYECTDYDNCRFIERDRTGYACARCPDPLASGERVIAPPEGPPW